MGQHVKRTSVAARATKTFGVLFQKAVAFHVNLIDRGHGMHTCSRVLVIFSMAKGVMKPSEPIAKGTKGGTEPLPRMEQVHSTVPSPPRVTTASKPSAT